MNNYASGPWRQLLPVPDLPTEWDNMQASLKMTQAEARRLLKRPGRKADTLRRWIDAHHRERYIPSGFLTRRQLERFRWD